MFISNFNSSDPSRPSFFEMIAQQEMIPTLKPALRYVLSIIAQRNPNYYWLFHYCDEIFLSLLLLIENHHLKYYDASFAENFYGLKRVKVDTVKTVIGDSLQTVPSQKNPSSIRFFQYSTSPLKPSDRYLSLFLLVIVPYLKTKLDELYIEMFPLNRASTFNIIRNSEQNLPSNQPNRKKTIWSLLKARILYLFEKGYPYCNALYEAFFFIFQFGYLYEYLIYYTPFLFLQKITLKRLSIDEIKAQETENLQRRAAQLNALTGPLGSILKLFLRGYNVFLDYGTLFLPASIFFFKFLEWWYTENPLGLQQSVMIPPPDPPKISPNGIKPSSDKKICSLCRHNLTNPALASSGYVFCFPCIHSYVKENGCCPITKLPCDETQIRRIYEST